MPKGSNADLYWDNSTEAVLGEEEAWVVVHTSQGHRDNIAQPSLSGIIKMIHYNYLSYFKKQSIHVPVIVLTK